MSDQEKKGDELDFDWDEALAAWERELDAKAVAVSDPMPQTPAPKQAPRAFYRPPDPNEFNRPVARGPSRPPFAGAPVARPPEVDIPVSFEEDDDQESTRIAPAPSELIQFLQSERDAGKERHQEGKEGDQSERTTARPPPPEGGVTAVPFDVDDMLASFEQDTRVYPAEVPRIRSPMRTPSGLPPAPSPFRGASAPPSAKTGSEKAGLEKGGLEKEKAAPENAGPGKPGPDRTTSATVSPAKPMGQQAGPSAMPAARAQPDAGPGGKSAGSVKPGTAAMPGAPSMPLPAAGRPDLAARLRAALGAKRHEDQSEGSPTKEVSSGRTSSPQVSRTFRAPEPGTIDVVPPPSAARGTAFPSGKPSAEISRGPVPRPVGPKPGERKPSEPEIERATAAGGSASAEKSTIPGSRLPRPAPPAEASARGGTSTPSGTSQGLSGTGPAEAHGVAGRTLGLPVPGSTRPGGERPSISGLGGPRPPAGSPPRPRVSLPLPSAPTRPSSGKGPLGTPPGAPSISKPVEEAAAPESEGGPSKSTTTGPVARVIPLGQLLGRPSPLTASAKAPFGSGTSAPTGASGAKREPDEEREVTPEREVAVLAPARTDELGQEVTGDRTVPAVGFDDEREAVFAPSPEKAPAAGAPSAVSDAAPSPEAPGVHPPVIAPSAPKSEPVPLADDALEAAFFEAGERPRLTLPRQPLSDLAALEAELESAEVEAAPVGGPASEAIGVSEETDDEPAETVEDLEVVGSDDVEPAAPPTADEWGVSSLAAERSKLEERAAVPSHHLRPDVADDFLADLSLLSASADGASGEPVAAIPSPSPPLSESPPKAEAPRASSATSQAPAVEVSFSEPVLELEGLDEPAFEEPTGRLDTETADEVAVVVGAPPQPAPSDDLGPSLGEVETDRDEEPVVSAARAVGPDEFGPDEFGPDDELDELAPPPEDRRERTAPDSARAAKVEAADRGAAAARRTVRSRKPRVEVFPLVGRSGEALEARRHLMLRLAELSVGQARARLLLAVAEIDHQLGKTEDARQRIAEAREADPEDVLVLRAARRDAIARGAHAEAASLLEIEAQLPLSVSERSAALLALAEIRLVHLGDPVGAEKAALEALALSPRSVVAALLVAEARAAMGRETASAEALFRAGESWNDGRMRAVLRTVVARRLEKEGDRERALELYRAAVESDPGAVDARLGVARLARGSEAAEALAAIAASMPEGALRDALARRAAQVAISVAPHPGGDVAAAAQRALRWLEGSRTVPALRTRALVAARAGDRDAEILALEAWAGASGGTERAIALVRLAEVLAEAGNLDAADETLRAAALADGSLGTIRILRELMARRYGDRGRLVQAVDSAGAVAAAAKLAGDPSSVERERSLVAQARNEDEVPLCAHVLWLDLAAASGDAEGVASALRDEIGRAPPDRRIGALLALADRALFEGDVDGAEKTLQETRAIAPGDPLVLRPLARLASARSRPEDAAALWLEEAAAASGTRAAFAATMAGVLLESSAGEAISAHRRALTAQPGYGPALWSLEPLARQIGDVLTLQEVHEQEAEATPAPLEAAMHWVRAAWLRVDVDPAGAAALLARAREKAPADTIAVELALRLQEGMGWAERVALLERAADDAPELLARAYRLLAAAALEDAHQPARAAAIYRALAERVPDDPITLQALDRTERAAGEIARVAERCFAAVRNAPDDATRVEALERLAWLDLQDRQDPASAMLSLHSILEIVPGHLPSLRMLERHLMTEDRRDALPTIEERLVEHLEAPEDVAVHLRFAARLRLAPAEASGDAADDLLLAHARRARMDLWLARHVATAARAAGAREVAASMEWEIAARMPTPLARASMALRAAELRSSLEGGSAQAIEWLAEAVASAPEHGLAAEALGVAREAVGDAAGAAEAFTIAARAAHAPLRSAALWYRAGVLWQDSVGDEDRALEALLETSRIDVGYADVFERLREVLTVREDHATLSELIARRIAAGGDPAALVELLMLQAEIREKLGDRQGARQALKSALALAPEKLDAARRVAKLALEDGEYREAAEALIRIARLCKDIEELRWVFFTLGDIYDRHIPDAKRAEAAFRRVLKLAPGDVPALERLATLYRREHQFAAAAEQLEQLIRVEPDPDRVRAHQLAFAEVLEQMGDGRRAEQVLEAARRSAPTDLVTIKALADFYGRQRAHSALAIHLNRAVADLRRAIETDLGDSAAWFGMVEILQLRGRRDPARAVAAMAMALGHESPEWVRLVDGDGVPGAGAAAADASLDDLLAPEHLPTAVRTVMRIAGPALERIAPFDPRAYRAEKLGARDIFRLAALDIARWFGVGDVEVWVTTVMPRACMPVASGPPASLVVGRDLLGLDERERMFVLVRTMKVVHDGLTLALRMEPTELALLLGALVHVYDPNYRVSGVDGAHLADWSRRISKQLGRRTTEELHHVVVEMAGSPDYDPLRLATASAEFANRVALVAGGSARAALGSLLKLAGEPGLAESPSARLSQLTRCVEARALVSFAVSEAHFEARHRTGADRG